MALRRFCTDWRNPAKWTKLDRTSRPAQGASVSNVWTRSPFGIRPIETFVAIQPGVFRVDGKPAGALGAFNYEFGRLVDENPEWSLVSGHPIRLWPKTVPANPPKGTQTVTAIDLTRLDVIEAWTDFILAHFAWANGIHHDYLTNLAWLVAEQGLPIPSAFWRAWDTGYTAAIQRMRLRRPDWKFLGQQYHLTPLTPYVDGLFIEEHPQFTGTLLATHDLNMKNHGGPAWVFEIRSGNEVPPELIGKVQPQAWRNYVATCVEWVRERDASLSWGRDETALVDCPS